MSEAEDVDQPQLSSLFIYGREVEDDDEVDNPIDVLFDEDES